MELVASAPWWVGVVVGVAAYVVLHRFAAREVVVVTQSSQVSAAVLQSMGKTAASIGQYVVPLLCFAGSSVSAWRRRERRSLVAEATKSDAAGVLDGMNWRQFERLVAEAFRLQGFHVAEIGGGGADGGIDLVLKRGGETFLVQCKQWKAFKVGVEVVRELYGVMAAKGAAGGFVVTSGRFTAEARDFASGRNVRLIEGPQLQALLGQASASGSGTQNPSRAQASARTAPFEPATPTCPLCSKPMVRRTAKRGSNAGVPFWGCTRYPDCRGTRPIA